MSNQKNRAALLIASILILSMLTSLILLPTINAHTPPWEIPTFAYIHVAPNPVGVGQQVLVVMWIDKVLSSASLTNSIRFHDYKLTITKPDGTTQLMTWNIIWDTTSSQYTPFVPDQVGTYTFTFDFPQQVYTWSGTYQGDIYLASSKSTTLVVQEEQLPPATRSYPLPTEYWTRPIEAQNTDWWTITSHWLGTGCPQWTGGRKIQPDGIAPNSAHVMWTRPVQDGGVVGGSLLPIEGETVYAGLSYNQRFTNAIIMSGRLFYELPLGNAASGGGYMAVDLRTGEELWWLNRTAITPSVSVPSFGYYYSYEHPNQHGVIPNGLLFTSNFGRAIEPLTGRVYTLNVTGVPSGTGALGPSGEHLRYVLTNLGTSTNPNWYLAQWNSSKCFTTQTSGTINASQTSRYDWNVSVPPLPGLSNPTIIRAVPNDFIFGRSSNFLATSSSTNFGTPNPFTFWAVSIKPESRGQLLWIKNYPAPAGNLTLLLGADDPASRVFTLYMKETMQWFGYSMNDGQLLWGPTPIIEHEYDYYNALESVSVNCPIVYGRLYYSGYAGILYCYDAKNGTLLWTYGNGGLGNSTYSGFETVWGRYPIWIGAVADGKIFLHTSEHSPNTPIYKNARYRAIDAFTGEEVWTILGFGGMFGPTTQIFTADGFVVYLNSYDMQIYSIGKGPSATTVTASPKVSVYNDNVLIEGTINDIAAGTKQSQVAARFPFGVPAVSDESMSQWMEYVYMQKPRPTNATGVDVTLSVLDPNGNTYEIGTAISDAYGAYSLVWNPPVPGKYLIFAKFAGTESFWPSYAETAIDVAETPVASPTYEAPLISLPPIEMYVLGTGVAIILAIAIVGILILRKKA